MEPTTGLILRRIMQTDLSVSAHKLATLILDGIAWKEGYNGLSRGTAAFTLSVLAKQDGHLAPVSDGPSERTRSVGLGAGAPEIKRQICPLALPVFGL